MRKMAILLAFLACSGAKAQEFPKFDGGKSCPPRDFKCDITESAAGGLINEHWFRYQPLVKQLCIYWAITHGQPSYRQMGACLDDPMGTARKMQDRAGAVYRFLGRDEALPLPSLAECEKLRAFIGLGSCAIH